MAEGTYIYNPAASILSYNEETTFNETPSAGSQTTPFGLLSEEVKLPDPEIEMHVHRTPGGGANPAIVQPGARTLAGSLPITLQNALPLKYLLGSSTGGTISCVNGNQPSMCVEALWVDSDGDEFLRYFTGTVVTGGSIAAEEEGFLKANLDIESAYAINSPNSPSSVTQYTNDPFVFCEGVATYFGSTYARVLDFNIDIKRAFKARRYIQTNNACYPYEINFGPRDIEMSTTIVASDDLAGGGTTYYDELLSPTSGGSNMTLEFTSSSGTIDIFVTGASIKSAPHVINIEAEDSPVSVELVAKDITVVYT